MKKYSSPIPVIEGVEVVPTPVFKSEDYSPEKLAKCVRAAHHATTLIPDYPEGGLSSMQPGRQKYVT